MAKDDFRKARNKAGISSSKAKAATIEVFGQIVVFTNADRQKTF